MAPFIFRPISVLIFASSVFCFGCTSQNEGKLDLVSFDRQHDFAQTFTQAYIARNDMGDMDIMLVQDGAEAVSQPDPSKPLAPDPTDLPRQYVHIRVFWKPLNARADHPASTNASVQWCLLGNGPDSSSVLEYDGSGLVILGDGGDATNVTIRTAWMKALTQRGDLVDPLGPSDLHGKFQAVTDPERVSALLAEMKSATGVSQVQATPLPGAQPQRLSISP